MFIFLELFPVPVKIIQLDISESQSIEIINQIDQESLEINSLIKSGYKSKTNTFLDRRIWFKEILQKEINTYAHECDLIPAKLSYSWCNKYTNKGQISAHKHELSIISGVYCVLIKGGNSLFKIKNPCNPFKINEISKKINKFNQQEFDVVLEEKMLILFPSWVEHYTQNEAKIKYSISFDTEINR